MPKPLTETPREVCYKKILMTDGEHEEYLSICKAYDAPARKGESLFVDMFEVDDDGRLLYIKALGKRQSSFEVIFFLFGLMQNQWLRVVMRETNNELKKIRVKSKILDNKIKEVDKRLQLIDNKIPIISKIVIPNNKNCK